MGAIDLLRMLEPIVRPGNVPGPTPVRAAAAPIESQSFESLLSNAPAPAPGRETEPAPEAGSQPMKPPSPLRELGQVDHIENAALRELINRVGGANRSIEPSQDQG